MSNSRRFENGYNVTDLSNNRKNQSNLKIMEYMNATAIFAHYLPRGFKALNTGISRYIFFPLALAGSMLDVFLALNQIRLERKLGNKVESSSKRKLLLEVLAFGATAAALIGGFIAPALFVLLTPVLLIASVGLKAVYDLGSAAFLFLKSFRKPRDDVDAELKVAERATAKRDLVSGLVNSAITAGLGLLAFTGLPLVYVLALGVGGSIVGVALNALEKNKDSKVSVISEPDVSQPVAYERGSTALVGRKLEVVYRVDPELAVDFMPSAIAPSSYTGYQSRQQPHTLSHGGASPLLQEEGEDYGSTRSNRV
jgi:hypothetical protein